MIRNACADDATALAAIYNHYILHSPATFEEEVLTADQLCERVEAVQAMGLPWLVALDGAQVVGYAYASRWRERSAFRFSVESTVYLAPHRSGEGWGSRLYAALFARLREGDVHAVMAGITLPNAASVSLHEKAGMHKVAHFEEVGYKMGQWLDVGYWQIKFDRRRDSDAG